MYRTVRWQTYMYVVSEVRRQAQPAMVNMLNIAFFNMLMLAFRTYVSEHSRCQDGSNLLALLNSNINISQKSNISKAICIMREN